MTQDSVGRARGAGRSHGEHA